MLLIINNIGYIIHHDSNTTDACNVNNLNNRNIDKVGHHHTHKNYHQNIYSNGFEWLLISDATLV